VILMVPRADLKSARDTTTGMFESPDAR